MRNRIGKYSLRNHLEQQANARDRTIRATKHQRWSTRRGIGAPELSRGKRCDRKGGGDRKPLPPLVVALSFRSVTDLKGCKHPHGWRPAKGEHGFHLVFYRQRTSRRPRR